MFLSNKRGHLFSKKGELVFFFFFCMWCYFIYLIAFQLDVSFNLTQLVQTSMRFLAGDAVSIPLSRAVTSIWPLPSGLLLQQTNESNSSIHSHFSSSSPYLTARDLPRSKKDMGYSPQQISSLRSSWDHMNRGDGALVSSHLILKDPLEEPQVFKILSAAFVYVVILYNAASGMHIYIFNFLLVNSLFCWLAYLYRGKREAKHHEGI